VLNGKRHGPGRMSFRDSPVSYTGDWHHGQRHGQGTITLNVEGSHYYKGVIKDSSPTCCKATNTYSCICLRVACEFQNRCCLSCVLA
jgi:hypothetical protein